MTHLRRDSANVASASTATDDRIAAADGALADVVTTPSDELRKIARDEERTASERRE